MLSFICLSATLSDKSLIMLTTGPLTFWQYFLWLFRQSFLFGCSYTN